MSKLSIFSVIVVLTCCLFSCISVEQFSSEELDPTSPRRIEVYSTRLPERKYTEIAEITLTGGEWNRGNNIKKIKKKAAALGADAIILTSHNYQNFLTSRYNSYSSPYTYRATGPANDTMRAIAIKFTEKP